MKNLQQNRSIHQEMYVLTTEAGKNAKKWLILNTYHRLRKDKT